MSLPYWEYFLSLESDLEQCAKYIDFSQTNFNSNSVEFAKIIMISSAEIDTISKEICKLINPSSTARNINHYASEILQQYPNLTSLEIDIPRYSITLKPWDGWSNSSSPAWWTSYNNIKHDRTANFTEANLENTLLSISGLLVMILYFYDAKYGTNQTMIDAFFSPKLLSPIDQTQASFGAGGVYWSYVLA